MTEIWVTSRQRIRVIWCQLMEFLTVIGYKNFAPCNSGGTSKVYLKVATGWGNVGDTEYILYNSINVISKYGIVWEYKPK